MRRAMRIAIVAAGVATALMLAGCTGASTPVLEPTPVGAAAATVTAGGTALTLGETAWIKDDGQGGSGSLVGTTVREVRRLDRAAVEGLASNAALAAYTPYGIVVQFDYPPDTANVAIEVLPIVSSGEVTQWMALKTGQPTLGDGDACGIPLADPGNGTALECFVALSTEADGPVVGAIYNGSTRAATFIDDRHPYAHTPITWRG